MGKKQLIKNLLANIISFGASILISFIISPYLISTIGKEAYAFFPIANNFVSYFTIITLSLNSMTSRFITIQIVKNNVEKAKTYYSSVFFANIIMIILLSVPLSFIVIYLDYILNIPQDIVMEVKLLFTLIFSAMIISVFTSVFGVATFTKNRLDLRSGGEILLGIIKITLYVFLFTLYRPSIVFVGVTVLILSLINFLIQLKFTKNLLPDFKISLKYFEFAAVKELTSSGFWNSLNSLGGVLLLDMSLLMANVLINVSASGELSIVQMLPAFISGIISMLFWVFMPRITHFYAEGNKANLIGEIKFSQKVIGLLCTTPIILAILFSKEFFLLWVPQENAARLQVLSVMTLLPLFVQGNMWTVYGLLIVLNKVKTPSITLICAGVLNIISVYISIKILHGSIITIPLIGAIINIIYYLIFVPIYAASKIGTEKINFYCHIIKTFAFITLFGLFILLIKTKIEIVTWLNFFFWCGVLGLIGLLLHGFFILSFSDFNKLRAFIVSKVKGE